MNSSWRAVGSSNDDLVNQLKQFAIIKHPRVEAAMRQVDRGLYSADPAAAYTDRPHHIGHGVTISAPHMHAFALERLIDLTTPGAQVLDVGSGSGYLTACFGTLVRPGGRVLGIDVIAPLVEWSRANMARANPGLLEDGTVTLLVGDAWKEIKGQSFDVIHVGAAAESVPDALLSALRPGGRMIIPVGTTRQWICEVRKDAAGKVSVEKLLEVQYVPLVKTPLAPVEVPAEALASERKEPDERKQPGKPSEKQEETRVPDKEL